MKYIIVITSLIMLSACNQQTDNTQQLQTQIDSLQSKLDNTYKPGFGDFMSGIQVHHAKLWFAGTNNNWKLADFEMHEIQEALDDIQKFNTERPEAKVIGMINPAMDSISNAIKQQNQQLFKSSYTLLTNTCNNCHRATEHEFNVITIPANPPISNQSFKTVQ
ncbi:MAG: hypothetical protein NTX08_02585 [Sphingobacteriales bacterium]|nr:hypothetical protein [Sphingobacteriales bacterium]